MVSVMFRQRTRDPPSCHCPSIHTYYCHRGEPGQLLRLTHAPEHKPPRPGRAGVDGTAFASNEGVISSRGEMASDRRAGSFVRKPQAPRRPTVMGFLSHSGKVSQAVSC
jgi:hypothetical protein